MSVHALKATYEEDIARLRIGSDGAEEEVTSEGDHSPTAPLEDVYRLPPTDIISIDEWKERSGGRGGGGQEEEAEEEPLPDYSDDDEDQEEEDYAELRKSVKPKLKSLLSYDEWNQILASADRNGDKVTIPDPDYDDTTDDTPLPPSPALAAIKLPIARAHSSPVTSSTHAAGAGDAAGQLISPKKLHNPVLESKERQQLHRELMLNQKMGKDVLHQKTELKKEMERRKELQKKKEEEEYQRSKRSSFDKKLEEQASKLKQVDKSKAIKEEEQPEFMRVHSKIKRTQPPP